jgi:DHA2 family multidrug resistance protein
MAASAAAFRGHSTVIEYGMRRVIVVTGVILATLLELIDTTIVNVALPYIQGNLGASRDEGTFIVTGYVVANVIVIPLTPWLQRRFGRWQYFFFSIVVFTLASIMCGTSRSLEELVFWRVIQGLGGGGLISTSQTILRDTFPPNQQGTASAIFAVGAVVGPTIGPLMGGWITDQFSWPWIFFVNVPVGIVAALIALQIKNPEAPRKLKVDALGATLLAVGLGSLQYVLDQGQEKDWFSSDIIVWMSVVAVIGLVGFTFWELVGTKDPIVDLRILKNPTVLGASLLGVCLGVSLLGTLVTLPQYVQSQLGFTATLSGQLITFRALFVMVLTPPSARLAASGKISPALQIGIGFLALAISSWWLAQVTTPESSFWTLVPPMMLSGFALSQLFVPLTLVMFGAVKGPDIPKASALFNLSRQMGGSIATAVLVTMVSRQAAVHQNALAGSATLAQAPVRAYVQQQGKPLTQAGDGPLARIIQDQSEVLAYADTSMFTAILTFGFLPLVLVLRRGKRAPG